jgi:hypothetical protein
MGIKKTAPYNNAPYTVLADNIVCISLGAPRCMGTSVAKKFCDFVSQKKILFLRITTKGDPITAVPKFGFSHPCSDDSKMRMEVSEDCNSQLTMRPTPNVNYSGELDCLNYKARAYVLNALSHTIYLDILYTKAVDIPKFFKGIGIAEEVSRTQDKSTVCRLIEGQKSAGYKAIFFDVNKAREMPTTTDITEEAVLNKVDPNADILEETRESITTAPTGGGLFGFSSSKTTAPVAAGPAVKIPAIPSVKLGGAIAEDRRMTKDAFNSLVKQMVPLNGNLCPQSGTMANPFNDQIMPDLSCPGSKFGGRRRTRRYKKSNKSKKSKKSKKRRYK